MAFDDIERLLRSCLAGRITSIQLVEHGLVNDTYKVSCDGRWYALRRTPRVIGHADIAWEERVLLAAGAAGLAPLPIYSDGSKGILLSHWLPGEMLVGGQIVEPYYIDAVAKLVRRIQTLRVAPPLRRMSIAAWIEFYRSSLGDPCCQSASLQDSHIRADELLRHCGSQLQIDPVLCHSDLHLGNLVEGATLVAIDWEYAHFSHGWWDLAGWCVNNKFEDAQQSALLSSFLGRVAEPTERVLFRDLQWLYDYVCLLWREFTLRKDGRMAPDPAN